MKTIGQRIEEVRIERSLSKTDVWKGAGLSSGVYAQWLAGSKLSAESLLKVASLLGVDPHWLETGKGQKERRGAIDLEHHPEYSAIKRVRFKISAGVSGYEVEYLNGERAPIFFRRDWLEDRGLNPENLMAVAVSGQSMETSLYEGDLVVVNVADIAARDGEVFAVNYDGELVIKRLIKDAGDWYLSSDNQDKRRYPNKLCDERTIIIGRIVHKQSERI